MSGCKHGNSVGISQIEQKLWRAQTLCNNKTRNGKIAEYGKILCRDPAVNLLEVGDFGISEHLQPVRMQVLGVTGQCQSRLLNTRAGDTMDEPLLAGQKRQTETIFIFSQQVLY